MDVPPPAPAGPRTLLAVLRDTTFRSLRHRDYRLYFAGQIVSFTGSWTQSAALMWLVFDRTGDPAWPARLLVASVGPTLVLGTWGGNLADRLPKRDLIFRTQAGFLLTAVALAAAAALDLAHPWLLVGLQLVNGVIQAIDLPTRLAFVPDLVPRADLINAVSLNSLLFNAARATGPAVAGFQFLLAGVLAERGWLPAGVRPVTAGAALCFATNALSFVAVLVALSRIRATGERRGPAPKPGTALDGVRYVVARPVLGLLLLLTGALSVFGWPVLSLLPAYTRLVLGRAETEYTGLVSGLGTGALVGALVVATFGTAGRRGRLLSAGAGCAAAGLGGLTAAGGWGPAVASAGLLGFGLVLFLSTGQSTLQLSATDEARGRVMALWAMTLSASAPLGHLVTGELAARVGVVPVMTGMAVGVGAVAVAAAAVAARRGWQVR